MVSALGARTAERYRRLRAQALVATDPRPLNELLLPLLLKAERLYVRLERLLSDEGKEGEEETKSPSRLLMELAGTSSRVRLLARLNALMDMMSHDCDVPEPVEIQDWWSGINRERNRQATRLCRALGAEDVAPSSNVAAAQVKEEETTTVSRREIVEWVEHSDPEEQVEVLTLLLHAGDQDNNFAWTEREMKALQAAFDLVAVASNVCVMKLPDWFVAPYASELVSPSQANESDVDNDEMTLLYLSTGSEDRAFQEEQVIREATLWASLRHPNVLRLGGACHVGGRPFFTVSARATHLSVFFRSLHPQVVRHKVFIPMVLYEMAMALQLVHERGLSFSRGNAAGSCLSIDRVYCVPEDDKVRLLGAGLTNVAGSETTVDMIDGQQAQVDDICALGAAMADVLLKTQISRSLSSTLWRIVDEMLSESERITLPDVLARLKEMLWSRGEGLALPRYPSERTPSSSREPWSMISPNDVTLKQAIGNGSFASVHVGSWNGSQDVAIKQIVPPKNEKDATVVLDPDAFNREVTLWCQLSHINIVEMYGGCADGEKPFIVCGYASRGDLPSYLRAENQTPYVIWSRLLEAARGLQYLHRNGIVHGDIKGNNIVVGADSIAKIIDFGASFFASEGQPKALEGVGPVRWKAPECISDKETPGSPPTLASDVYSFGMCIIEAVSGEAPWGRQIEDVAVGFQVKNRRQLPQKPRQMSENEMALVQRICSYRPENRLSMDYIVNYIECLVDRFASPAKIASTPALLHQNSPSATDLLSLVTIDDSGFGDRGNRIQDPGNFFLTVDLLRRHAHKWTEHQLRALLSLLGSNSSDNLKLWVARTLGQIVTDNEAAVKSVVGSTPEVIASVVELLNSELPELQLAAAVALQCLSVGNDSVKRSIGDCGGLGALLGLIRSDSTAPETKKASIATLRNAATIAANRVRMTQSSNNEADSGSGCATLVEIARTVTSGSATVEQASVRVNAVGALRNMAFQNRGCASAIASTGGIALLTSVLESGTDAEKVEAAGALWNIAAVSTSLSEQVATHQIANVLMKLVEGGEGGGSKSSLALQEQAIGALSVVLSSLRQRLMVDSSADDRFSVESVAPTMKRVVKESKSAAVRAMAADCARLALGTVVTA